MITLSSLLSCNSQTTKDSSEITVIENPYVDSIKSWLTEGQHVADLMNGYSPRATILSEKISKSIALHESWYFEFMKSIPEGEKMPYHENLGVSPEEYAELLREFDNIEVYSSNQGECNISYSGDLILFQSKAPFLAGLTYISLDLRTNKVIFTTPNGDKMTLYFEKEIVVEKNSNAFKSAWHGYKWVYGEGIENQDFEKINDISEIGDFSKFEFTLGRMDRDGRTFLNFKVQSMSNGKLAANNELPLLIK